jgi:hypothetical protein
MSMRFRNPSLTTGRLLACFDPQERGRNRSLLFLVDGTRDIATLTLVEAICRRYLERTALPGFEWFAVPDQGQIASVDPSLVAVRVKRLEVSELADLDTEDLEGLLGPALDRLAAGEPELFPSAGGAVGAPAEGIQLLGREIEIASLLQLLVTGRDILLLAPRRSGKTSVLRRLEKEAATEFRVVFLDLERDTTPVDAAARLWVLATGERYRLAQQKADEGWEDLLTRSLRTLTQTPESPRILLLLDELVFFLQNLRNSQPGETGHRQAVLHFFEALAAALSTVDARLVVAGSLDLGEYLHEAIGLAEPELPPLVRSLHSFPLPPLALQSPGIETRRILLGTGLVPGPEDFAWLTENVDLALPYPALRFLDELSARLRAEGDFDREHLEKELDAFLGKTEVFRDFEERLRRKGVEMPGATRAICNILDLLAEAPVDLGVVEERVREQLEREVPGKAERLFAWFLETFPIYRTGERLVFASRLFRKWWNRQLTTEEKSR